MARLKFKKQDGTWEYADKAGADVVVPTAEISANTAARHTHSNKSVLDGITAAKVSAWDGYESRVSALETALTGVDALADEIGEVVGTS